MKKLVSLLAIGLVVIAPTASALTQGEARECQALAESFGPAKAILEAKVAERDTLAIETEAAGEAWENAENVRTLGAEAAAEADALKVTFEEKKASFNTFEADLFERSQAFRKNSARFNNLCVTD